MTDDEFSRFHSVGEHARANTRLSVIRESATNNHPSEFKMTTHTFFFRPTRLAHCLHTEIAFKFKAGFKRTPLTQTAKLKYINN